MSDDRLSNWCELARKGKPVARGKGRLIIENGLLYRLFEGTENKQMVLRKVVRGTVLKIAHESPFGGHQGIAKTLKKRQQDFAWPGMVANTKRYCQSCDIYPRTVPKGKVGKVPLG